MKLVLLLKLKGHQYGKQYGYLESEIIQEVNRNVNICNFPTVCQFKSINNKTHQDFPITDIKMLNVWFSGENLVWILSADVLCCVNDGPESGSLELEPVNQTVLLQRHSKVPTFLMYL